MIHFNENLKLSYKQLDTVFSTACNIIDSLPPVAINQLVEGYGGDITALQKEIFIQTNNVLTLDSTLNTEKLSYIEQLEESMDETLKIQSYNYFKTTMLPNFRQGWRNLEWGNMIQLYPSSAYLAARSHGKCFARGTRILMADFSVRNVEDIFPGMEVMGVDFTPRKVLTRHMGRAQMFRVEQENGMPYAVNRAHIMCLWDTKHKQYAEIEMGRFLKYPVKKQKRFQGYRVFSYDKPVFEKGDILVEPIGEESYYGFMCDGDHLFQLEDGTVVHNSYEFCFAFPLWRLYSYKRPNFMRPNTPDNKNRQETCIITNTEKLGKEHIDKVVEEIKTNEAFAAVINPTGKASLAATSIEGENGTKLHLRGKDGFIRGLHVGAAVSDDLPDESSIYSLEQREKLRDLFKGAITPIVEPYGYNIVDGTPYQADDLYNDLKKDPKFKVFEYPAIFPDGRLLAPDRFTYSKLMEEKNSLGTMVFSREYLVVPISDDSTIFPWEILRRSTVGMEGIRLAENIESFPIKLQRVVAGCDFAVSGNVGADYTCYTVWGRDLQDNYYLLYIYREKGLSHNEQIAKISWLNNVFKPNEIVVENNGFQSILADMCVQQGIKNITPFTTTSGNKKDLRTGWASLAALFERGSIHCPYHPATASRVDQMFGEFNSIAFRSDKGTLESISGHDDTVSSSFMAINKLRESTVQIKVDAV
jgi:phage terminase large subunit-like protein